MNTPKLADVVTRVVAEHNARPTSPPDWRAVFAKTLGAVPMPPGGPPDYWDASPMLAACADAILAAIAERGYRLHRDHDWKTTPEITYPVVVLQCQRPGCHAVSPGLSDNHTCEGEP